jgi:hypothetical protein
MLIVYPESYKSLTKTLRLCRFVKNLLLGLMVCRRDVEEKWVSRVYPTEGGRTAFSEVARTNCSWFAETWSTLASAADTLAAALAILP